MRGSSTYKGPRKIAYLNDLEEIMLSASKILNVQLFDVVNRSLHISFAQTKLHFNQNKFSIKSQSNIALVLYNRVKSNIEVS